MRIASYNILYGGKDEHGNRLQAISEVLHSAKPDIACIQEANHFQTGEHTSLSALSHELHLPSAAISIGGSSEIEYQFNVATLSKHPFTHVNDFNRTFRNACLQTVIKTPVGDIALCNAHLSPANEDERLKEIEIILKSQAMFSHQIILGDMNSLSPDDSFENDFLARAALEIKHKFSTNGRLRFDVIRTIKEHDYVDAAVHFKINSEKTVPTKIPDLDPAHQCPLRIDYVFISSSLLPYLKSLLILKTSEADTASDHYPLLAEFDF